MINIATISKGKKLLNEGNAECALNRRSGPHAVKLYWEQSRRLPQAGIPFQAANAAFPEARHASRSSLMRR
jgi:hypothetical protein